MRLSRLFLSLAGLQVFAITTFAASVPTPPKASHTSTASVKHAVSQQQADEWVSDTFQSGTHAFVGVGFKQEKFPSVIAMKSFMVAASSTSNEAFYQKVFPSVTERTITAGLHFTNNHLFTGLMGHENSVSLSYGFATKNGDINRAITGSGANIIDNYTHGGTFNPTAITGVNYSGKIRQYDLALTWLGHKTFAGSRFSMDPGLSIVSSQMRVDTTSYTQYLLGQTATSVDWSKMQMKYWGVELGNQFNFQLAKRASVGLKLGVQVLHADARFHLMTAINTQTSNYGIFTLHENRALTLRQDLGVSLRYALFNRKNSAYFVVSGGAMHWDWVPYATTASGTGYPGKLTSRSMWVPYWGLNFVVPYA